MRVIINADDFGINEGVTAAIEKAITTGSISSTSVMANGSCLGEVARFAKEHPEASYGIHLCLSEFDSLTKSDGLYCSGITDANGTFRTQAIFDVKSLEKTETQQAIRDELNAQIDIVSSLGFVISHADSHHHVHTIYPLRNLFADVLIKRGIKRVRLGADFNTLRMKAHLGLWAQRILLNEFYKKRFSTANSFLSYAEYVKKGCLSKEGETTELMCHPGHPGAQFCAEMKLVDTKIVLKQKGVDIITYNDLR